jgi:hypothetical protein
MGRPHYRPLDAVPNRSPEAIAPSTMSPMWPLAGTWVPARRLVLDWTAVVMAGSLYE